jgi:hypothetical protein
MGLIAEATWVLVHSPLVGPVTWSLVKPELEARGARVAVPELRDGDPRLPYWKQHATSVGRALDAQQIEGPVVLVGHSGAGPLLPSIRQEADRQVGAYIFVDAGIARDGESRLDAMRRETPEFAEELYEYLRGGGRFPDWGVELLTDIPSSEVRRQVIDELQPRGLDFFEEAIPVFAGWPDAPCGYLQFTVSYEAAVAEAAERGWSMSRVAGGHFQMLADPLAVTEALAAIAEGATRK